MVETEVGFLTNPFFTNVILPFLLIFTVIFAILEKTSLLGQGKKYANIIVALVVGFLFIGVQTAVGFTVRLIPLVAMLIMILLCFYLLFGFMNLHAHPGLQITLGIIFGIALIVTILWASGLMQKMMVGGSAEAKSNAIGIISIMAVVGGAIALVVSGQPKPGGGA